MNMTPCHSDVTPLAEQCARAGGSGWPRTEEALERRQHKHATGHVLRQLLTVCGTTCRVSEKECRAAN